MSIKDISLEWRNQNEHIRNMSLPISFQEFGLDHLQRSLAFQFKILTFMTQTQDHLQKLYKNPQQFPFNRNPHIMTFNPTRVILSTQEQKDKIQNYINANLILIKGMKSIATQGPLTSTFYNLFRMIEKHNVTSIFMLCSLMEKNKKKCDRYWPILETETGKMTQKQYQITLLSQERTKHTKIRKINIKNNNSGFQTILTHYNFVNWPDGDRPLNQDKKQLEFLMKQFLKNAQKGQSPMVHCSAGVGRTGTFMAMSIFKKIILQGNQISIFQEVRRLRQQRWGMVYTFSQYEYLYDFVQQQIQRKKNKLNQIDDSQDQQLVQNVNLNKVQKQLILQSPPSFD